MNMRRFCVAAESGIDAPTTGRLRERNLVLRQAQDEVATLLIFLILSLSKDEGNRSGSDICEAPATKARDRGPPLRFPLTAADLTVRACAGAPDDRRAAVAAWRESELCRPLPARDRGPSLMRRKPAWRLNA
jgi:hypothetical protein